MRIALRLALVFLIFLSISADSYSQAPFAQESSARSDLREAVFRSVFDHYTDDASVKFYCIAAERPLPDSFIHRFSQSKPHVVWAFECDNSGPMNSIRYSKTGERGLLMKIRSIEWISGQEAEVRVEVFSDGIAANWNTLSMILNEGRWKVAKDKSDGVS
jgi:hypothetical protein